MKQTILSFEVNPIHLTLDFQYWISNIKYYNQLQSLKYW